MSDSSPICRCRVLYLGSAVPRHSKDGLQGIQEPLRCLYPLEGLIAAKGIDSWLSVWSNGILLENVDDNLRHITKFFSIQALHYCAAVRHVLIPTSGNLCPEQRFLPLDSPFAQTPRAENPPIFAAILRRTTGIKVLECHVFICKREAAANALVRCCFHSYADHSYARQLTCTNASSPKNSFRSDLSGNFTDKNSPQLACESFPLPLFKQNFFEKDRFWSFSNNQLKGRKIEKGWLTFRNSARSEIQPGKELFGSTVSLNKINGEYNNTKVLETTLRKDSIHQKVKNGNAYSDTWSTLNRPPRARQVEVPIVMPPPEIESMYNNGSNDQSFIKTSQYVSNDANNSVSKLEEKLIKCELDRNVNLFYITKQFPAPKNYSSSTKRQESHHPEQNLRISSLLSKNHILESSKNWLHPSINGSQFLTLQPLLSKNKQRDQRELCSYFKSHHSHNFDVKQRLFAPASETQLLNHNQMKKKPSFVLSLDNSLNSPTQRNTESEEKKFLVHRQSGHLNERAFSFSIRQEHRSRSFGSLASFESLESKNSCTNSHTIQSFDLNENIGMNSK